MTIDQLLIERAILGESAAIERLLRDCRPDLQRYAAKVCPRWSEVEDVVQSSLVSIYRGLGRLQAAGAFLNWATKIVRRQCWKTFRPLTTVGLDGIEDERCYLDSRNEEELRMDIAMALQSLPRIHRDVLILRDLEQLTVTEVAERLNIEVGTVKSRSFRARESVRKYLLAGESP